MAKRKRSKGQTTEIQTSNYSAEGHHLYSRTWN